MPSAPTPTSVPAHHAPGVSTGCSLATPAVVSGVTLFTAASSTLIIRPAPEGHGIVFRRTDLPDQPRVPALISHLVPESRHTVLSAEPGRRGAAVVHTVEHILSALAAMGVRDALLDLHGPEVPIGDGSAQPFTDVIAVARTGSNAAKANGSVRGAASGGGGGDGAGGGEPIRIREPFVVTDAGGSARIEALPIEGENGAAALELEYRLDYGADSPIPAQRASLRLVHGRISDDYLRGIAPARTYCLLEEAQVMQKMGLFKHLQPRDMLVIGEDGRPIDNQLRFPDEPARHKLLDLLGDLSLAGRPIIGRVIASRSGHALNHEVARRLATMGG